MLETKLRAVENAAAAGLAIVLVCCVIPGENDGELGAIVEFAREHMPAVKGVYFQPISYFGIYPEDDIRRITIPDVIRGLAAQHPDLHVEDFGPGAYDHAQCSFNAAYMQDKSGKLRALTRFSRPPPGAGCGTPPALQPPAQLDAQRAQDAYHRRHGLQDAWNIDLMRVRRCSIQIIQKDGALVPLCSKYLSGCGRREALPRDRVRI